MASPNDERAPRKTVAAKPVVGPALLAAAPGSLPSAGGKAPPPKRFAPKYVPRLLAYDLTEYQDENWRQ